VEPVADASCDPEKLALWGEFHESVAKLPDEQCEVFDLIWYHGLTQEETADVLGISLSSVKRRWQSARVNLMESLGNESPF
jgi:RNA polymerase sigma-70 factor (ECF subfamily)